MARSEIARRGLRDVEIVQADALNTGLPEGGTIVLQDVDDISNTCVPLQHLPVPSNQPVAPRD
jgi:hypothetical protein